MLDEENSEEDASTTSQDAGLDAANEKPEETIEDVKAQLEAEKALRTKADEIAENQRIRAEKAEKAGKTAVEPAKKATPKAGEMSQDDLYAVIKADVPQEDINDVKEYATLKGITVAEALKSNVVKTILADKAEQRNIAEATNTGTARRGAANIPDSTLVENASKGNLPDDPAALAQARMRERKAKK